jgi:hypothetical protein
MKGEKGEWIRVVMLFLLSVIWGCGGTGKSSNPQGPLDPPGLYSTTFNLTENPISEGGNWVNGGVTGLDWTNVSTTPGQAIGHETGASFTDGTAVLQGLSWAQDQKATAVVFATAAPIEGCFQEVELRLRTVISPHSITGYEINYKFSADSSAYMQIVRWNGPVGDFTALQSFYGQQFGVNHGDTVVATIVGNVISAYKNGVLQGQATDSTFTSGSPGIGFNLENAPSGCSGTNPTYGFSSFTALDSRQGSF